MANVRTLGLVEALYVELSTVCDWAGKEIQEAVHWQLYISGPAPRIPVF